MTHSDHVVAMETVSEGLLPCPFCGGEGSTFFKAVPNSKTGFWWSVVCNDKCLSEGPMVGTEAEAVAAWNRRAPSELIASRLAKQAPAGWVLVPREATSAMIDAGNAHMAQVDLGLPFDLWRVMLAAAPSPVLGEPK